jgi:hypothetical protein
MMKKNCQLLQFIVFNLSLFIYSNYSFAALVTTTAGGVSHTTSGLYQPISKDKLPVIQKPGIINITPIPPVCVDSGTMGRRCGITAVTFCKINPDALNCHLINEQKKSIK